MYESGWLTEAGKGVTVADLTYECDPQMVLTATQGLLATWASTTDHYGARAGHQAYSTNGGVTWSTTQDTFPVASLTGDGGDWVASMELRQSPLRGMFRTSTDGGLTWTSPVQLNWSGTSWTYPAELAWMDDGTADGLLVATCYGPDGILAIYSTDKGLTWEKRTSPKVGAIWEEATENAVLMLADGTILMSIRNDATSSIELVTSADKGLTWSAPTTILTYLSGYPRMTMMPDGTILMTLRDATPHASPDRTWWIGWSKDSGTTWSADQMLPEFMMYGEIVPMADGTARMLGSSQDYNDPTRARVWLRKVSPITPPEPDVLVLHPTVRTLPQLRCDVTITNIPSWATHVVLFDGQTGQRLGRRDTAGSSAFIPDFTVPFGESTYVARAYQDEVEVGVGTVIVSVPEPPTSKIWISDPLDETSAFQVDMLATGDLARPVETAVSISRTISGRTIASVGAAHLGSWDIVIDTDGPEMVQRLQTFFANASSVLIRTGSEMFLPGRLYAVIPTSYASLRLYSTAIGGQWTLTVTPVDSPGILPVISTWTWEGLTAMCTALNITWADLKTIFPTWLDLARGPIGEE